MGQKKQYKKQLIKKKNLRENPEASESDEYSLDEQELLQKEIQEKVQQRGELYEDEDLGDFDFQEQNEEIEEEQEDFLDQIDEQLYKRLEEIMTGIQYKSKEHQQYELSNVLCLLQYFYMKYKDYKGISSHPVLNYIQTYEQNQTAVEKMPQEEVIKEEIEEEEGHQPLLITKAMYKNKGIPQARTHSKMVNNPRLKQKQKYKKTIEKMVSKGYKRRKVIEKVYQGEKGGIKVGINRATNINQFHSLICNKKFQWSPQYTLYNQVSLHTKFLKDLLKKSLGLKQNQNNKDRF